MLWFLTPQWILAITALAWHYALKCGFVSDDHAVIGERKDIIPDAEKRPKKEEYWIKVFNDGVLMFYLNRAMKRLFLNIPFWWHLLSLSIHLTNTLLLYKVALMFCSIEIASCAALLWAVNPMQNQIAVWCSGRPYGISAMLALVCMLCWKDPLIVAPLYIIGVITSVSIGFLPVLLKLMHPHAWQGNTYIALLFCMVPFVAWKFQKRFSVDALVMDRKNFHFNLRRFNNLARMYVYYIMALAFPVRMGWYHDAGFSYNQRWNGFNVWALIGYTTILWIGSRGVAGWWFLLGLLPQMNILATNSYLQDRYVYFGSMGLALLAAPAIIQHPTILIALLAIHASKAYTYSRHMINDEYLYKENWRNHPRAAYAINNLSFFLIQQRRYEEARAFIQRGLDYDKNNKLLWYNLGVTWAATGSFNNEEGVQRFFRAMECWKRALQIEPRWKKPMEDLQKVVKVLMDNKILTMDKTQGIQGAPPIYTPLMNGEVLRDGENREKGADNPEAGAATGSKVADDAGGQGHGS